MSSLKSLNKYLLRYRVELLMGLVWVILTNFCLVYSPKFVAHSIDTFKNPNFEMTEIYRYVSLAFLFSALAGFFLFLVRQTIIKVSRKIEYDLKNDFYSHLQLLSQTFFKQTSTGDLMSRATNDLNAVRNYLGPGIMYSLNTLFRLIFALSAMIAISPELTLYAMLPAPLLSYAVYKVGKIIHDRSQLLQESYSRISTKVQENLAGIRIVKSYTREENEIAGFYELNRDYYEKNLSLGRLQATFFPLMSGLLGLSVVALIWVGGFKVIGGTISLGEIAQFLIYVALLAWPLISIGWVTNIVQRAAASQTRLDAILNLKLDIADSEQVDRSIKDIQGNIEFKHVSYAFPANPTKKVLKDISFAIPKGGSIAIVGATGTGKSTLVNLIPRLIDATSGEIFIDGKNIKSIPLDVLRASIGFVPQDYFLFSDTIHNNVAFGVESASRHEVEAAAKEAVIYEDIASFPHGFDTMIGERGITLSGGQKQRTSIARALIRKPKILVLDDSLSAVDTKTEDSILRNLEKSTAEKSMTTILISHRISTVKHCDQILVLDEGLIAERGSHQELISSEGLYAKLYQKQLLEEEISALE